jgi:hypothetical protein
MTLLNASIACSSYNPYNPLLGGSRHSLIAIYSYSNRD